VNRRRAGRRRIRSTRPAGVARTAGRVALAVLLVGAGVSHLTWGRRGYRIVVPDWAVRLLHTSKDVIVIGSGIVEVALGAAALALPARRRSSAGMAIAVFFVAVFPGNVHQWRTRRPAPLLRSDRARFLRLFLQPVLVAWALWATKDTPGR
jgi:uncharacterized membrane protein